MLGPRKPSLSLFLFRFFGGLAGGIIGSLAIFAIYVLGTAFTDPESAQTLTLFIVLVMVFIGSMLTNIISVTLISYFDRQMHPKILTGVTQVFILQIVIFLVAVPLYLIVSTLDESYVRFVAAFHLLISMQSTAFLLDIISQSNYKILSVYSVALSSLASFGVLMIIYLIGPELILFFVIPPLLWGSGEVIRGLIETGYYYFYRLYGMDVLSEETNLEE